MGSWNNIKPYDKNWKVLKLSRSAYNDPYRYQYQSLCNSTGVVTNSILRDRENKLLVTTVKCTIQIKKKDKTCKRWKVMQPGPSFWHSLYNSKPSKVVQKSLFSATISSPSTWRLIWLPVSAICSLYFFRSLSRAHAHRRGLGHKDPLLMWKLCLPAQALFFTLTVQYNSRITADTCSLVNN